MQAFRYLALFAIVVLGAGCIRASGTVSNFEECAAAGYPIMESFPRQCRANGTTYVETVPRPETPQTPNAELGEAFMLRARESRGVDGGLRVTLLEIQDSRCKPDVRCIWAGELSARLKLEGPEETAPEQELVLGTSRFTTAQASGYHFLLKEATETSATLVITKEDRRSD